MLLGKNPCAPSSNPLLVEHGAGLAHAPELGEGERPRRLRLRRVRAVRGRERTGANGPLERLLGVEAQRPEQGEIRRDPRGEYRIGVRIARVPCALEERCGTRRIAAEREPPDDVVAHGGRRELLDALPEPAGAASRVERVLDGAEAEALPPVTVRCEVPRGVQQRCGTRRCSAAGGSRRSGVQLSRERLIRSERGGGAVAKRDELIIGKLRSAQVQLRASRQPDAVVGRAEIQRM